MSEPAAEPLRRSQYFGYAAGDVANNLTFSMVSAFLLIYYTDVAGISAATAGTLFLVVRIWGGIADLLAGGRVDETSSRWGRFRPYLLFGPVPLLLLLVAVFSIPSGFGDSGKVAWAFVSYALFQLAYSFVNIPYGSLSAAMTQDPDERSQLSMSRSIAASLTILVIALVVSPQIEGAENLQSSLTITTSVFAAIGLGLYLWCFATSQEVVQRGTGKVSLRQTVDMLRANQPLIILCLGALIFLGGMYSLQTVAVYYARDVLGNADLYIVLTLVQTVGMLIAAALIPKAAAAVGKKRTYLVAAAAGTVAALGVALAPSSNPWMGIMAYGLLGVPLGMVNTLIFAFQADTVDYGEWKSGVRAEGASYAVLSFMRKTGQGLGGAAAAYTIGLGGYISGAASQSAEAVTSVRVAAGGIPAATLLASGAVMLAYPLSERAFRRLVAETAERRAATATAAAAPRQQPAPRQHCVSNRTDRLDDGRTTKD
jgi:glucuronide carrier protein